MQYKRTDRLGEAIQQEISRIIQTELRDPRVGFVTITGLSLSADLRVAKVFVTVMGGVDAARKALTGLQSATPYVRRLLGERVKAKYTPELEFLIDRSLEEQAHLDRLFRELEKDHREGNGDLQTP
jgi:ribosome-binding factor A